MTKNIKQTIVSKEEWLTARKDFLEEEKEFTKLRDQLNAKRRSLPMVEVDKKYTFEGEQGQSPCSIYSRTDSN